MNNIRRKQINEMAERLSGIKDMLDELQREEEDYKDNMPENLQESERYYATEAACEQLEEAAGLVEEAMDKLWEIE